MNRRRTPQSQSSESLTSFLVSCVKTAATPIIAALSMAPAYANADWRKVSRISMPNGIYNPDYFTVTAEQVMLATKASRHINTYGDAGSHNLHTRKLCFSCRGAHYLLPQSFVQDLFYLHIRDSLVRASIERSNVIFSLYGADGGESYAVHFDFRKGRFYQRIVEHLSTRQIDIRFGDISADCHRWPRHAASISQSFTTPVDQT